MKKNTERLCKKALAEMEPFIEQLAREGLRGRDLTDKVDAAVRSRIRAFYNKKDSFTHASMLIAEIFGVIKSADSKAEAILYDLLQQEGVRFKFQYSIGPYEADYLIGDDLVLELDGPQHSTQRDARRDAYLRRMGYRVLRVPVWVLAVNPQEIIDEIKKL